VLAKYSGFQWHFQPESVHSISVNTITDKYISEGTCGAHLVHLLKGSPTSTVDEVAQGLIQGSSENLWGWIFLSSFVSLFQYLTGLPVVDVHCTSSWNYPFLQPVSIVSCPFTVRL